MEAALALDLDAGVVEGGFGLGGDGGGFAAFLGTRAVPEPQALGVGHRQARSAARRRPRSRSKPGGR